GEDERGADAWILRRPPPRAKREEERERGRQEPEPPVQEALEKGRRGGGVGVAEKPAGVEPALAREGVPRQHGEGQPGEPQPALRRAAHAGPDPLRVVGPGSLGRRVGPRRDGRRPAAVT